MRRSRRSLLGGVTRDRVGAVALVVVFAGLLALDWARTTQPDVTPPEAGGRMPGLGVTAHSLDFGGASTDAAHLANVTAPDPIERLTEISPLAGYLVLVLVVAGFGLVGLVFFRHRHRGSRS